MIALTKIRELDLLAPPQAGRAPHISAASALVRAGNYFYVAADDELSLGVFDASGAKPGRVVRLLDGELPMDPEERKAQKPDFESLVRLPAFPGCEHGALFVLGSGSKKTRRAGVLLGLDAAGEIDEAAQRFDLAAMFGPLRDEFDRLNIEGTVVCGDELRLFQRGNKKDRRNAIVRCKLRPVLDALSGGVGIPALEVLAIVPVELGEIDGIPLSFTDGAILPNGDMVFSAAAEDTEDAYNDGPCAGCAIGIAGPQGNLAFLEQTDQQDKIEGIEAREVGDTIELFVVTDADDAAVPASLFKATIKKP